ncbi:hypothetical protein EJF36_17990 [Bacillus sp. HMF5848]|uniref:C10 family peptidase n=1 Tax=Bacillus sp. HMF5848 TaxID=2495421 RepID=UPI000F7A5ED8|nr:C10 family peptidase [Bacillus sp. HMF5848]RSK28605.1 hypothetical protein EJF36_17990 [Bacillus sp. HMF5848]
MKKLALTGSALLLAFVVSACGNQAQAPTTVDSKYNVIELADTPKTLIETAWKQEGPFTAATPNHELAGQWPVGLAEIMYYHELQPGDAVQYTTSNDTTVDENFGLFRFKWQKFEPTLDDKSHGGAVIQVSTYLYYAAATIHKDFGTEGYLLTPQEMVPAIEKHYAVDAEAYVYDSAAAFDQYKADITSTIKDHIDNKQPIFFAYGTQDLAAVIDGYKEEGDSFYVHLAHTGWFDLFKSIRSDEDDLSQRVILTVAP